MAKYNEQVLYSSYSGQNSTVQLTASQVPFDYVRISYGSPANAYVTSTPMNNMGPMHTVTYPTGYNKMMTFGMFCGTVSTTDFNNPYRIAHALSGCNTTSWTNVFNRYGLMNTYSATVAAPWTNIYSVVGIKTGEQGNFHRDLLYDIYRDGSGSNISLREHPSAYKRIGLVCGCPSAPSVTTTCYQEYPTAHLSAANGQNAMVYNNFIDSMHSCFCLGMYGNCWSKNWTRRWGYFGFENFGYKGTDGPVPYIYQVIGIDRN
jgi:hypothetical protein